MGWPCGSHLHATLPPALRHPSTRIAIFNLSGRRLVEVRGGGWAADRSLPIGGLSPGAYLFEAAGAAGTLRAAFVK